MASNNSAVLDVVSESKEITSLLKQTKDNDLSLSNNSIVDNTSSMVRLNQTDWTHFKPPISDPIT